jgi:LemA protein
MAGIAGAVAENPGVEGTPIDAILASRAQALGARTRSEKIAADERVERALARLSLFEEIHPDLRSSENLGNIERKVAIARGSYNDAVLRYNLSLVSFPRNIAARIFGFRQENDYFKPDAGSESSK